MKLGLPRLMDIGCVNVGTLRWDYEIVPFYPTASQARMVYGIVTGPLEVVEAMQAVTVVRRIWEGCADCGEYLVLNAPNEGALSEVREVYLENLTLWRQNGTPVKVTILAPVGSRVILPQ